MKKLSLLSLGALALAFSACSDDPEVEKPIDPGTDDPTPEEIVPIEEQPLESWNFLDADGRVLILRGVNLAGVSKGETGLPGSVEMTQADAEHFKDLGFNSVRYLIQWKNIEPEPGAYDLDYLASVRERLDILHEQGIYAVLDMHQDVYSPYFGFNGAPAWAVRDDGIVYNQQVQWFTNYMQPAVQRAFDNFFAYDEHKDLQDSFAAMWRKTAEVLGDHPGVVGFDIINEPHPGTKLDYLEFGIDNDRSSHIAFDRERLQPFYQRVINAIREVSSDKYILFEPRYGTPGDGAKCYMGKLEDPREGNRRLFQAPHFYILAVEATPVYGSSARARVAKWETERSAERDKNVHGTWLGEFGTFTSVDGYADYMNDILAITERMRIGFAGWSWDAYEFGMIGDRDPETLRYEEGPFLDILSRPYPRAIAGVPTHIEFVPEERALTFTWTVDPAIDAPTEIFAGSDRWYPSGFELLVDGISEDDYVVEYVEDGDLLLVHILDENAGSATLTLRPLED